MDQTLAAQFSLDGRGAVIVGAASGIGRQAAVTFAQAGARVILADQNRSGLDEVRQAVNPWCPDAEVMALDVRSRSAVQGLGEFAVGKGRVDVWANVAGVISDFSIAEATEADVSRIVDVNLMGTYWGCSTAARIMTQNRCGSIINISSAGAEIPSFGLSAYAMAKAAVIMLTKTLALEVGPAGVRANAVAPGFIDTPMVSYLYRNEVGSIDEAKRQEIFQLRAGSANLRRTGTPADIALTMLFLASDASSFITGQLLRANGGLVIH